MNFIPIHKPDLQLKHQNTVKYTKYIYTIHEKMFGDTKYVTRSCKSKDILMTSYITKNLAF